MTIENIDTSKFLVDPRKTSFIKTLIKSSIVFDIEIKGVSQIKALTYLILMYDKESYFRKEIKNFLQRKYEAGITSGFALDGEDHFIKEAEDMMLGGNESFNRAVTQYVSMQHSLEYAKLVVYEINFYKLIKDSFSSFDKKGDTKKLIDSISAEINELEEVLFGGKEAINMRRALYEGTARSRLNLRPEDIHEEYAINKLRHLSPWGNHDLSTATEVNFVGDEVPKE
jgi:hypothetical protein